MHRETSSLRTLKIMPRNLKEIVRSGIRLLYLYIFQCMYIGTDPRSVLLQKEQMRTKNVGLYQRVMKKKGSLHLSNCLTSWSISLMTLSPVSTAVETAGTFSADMSVFSNENPAFAYENPAFAYENPAFRLEKSAFRREKVPAAHQYFLLLRGS